MRKRELSNACRYLVAKSGRNQNDRWLPWWMHEKDTAGVMKWLIENWIPESVRQILLDASLQGRMTRKELLRLACFIAYAHDTGKNSVRFQRLVTKTIANALDRLKDAGVSVPLCNEADFKRNANHAYIGEILLRSYGCPESIASVIGAHHGMPQSITEDTVNEVLSNDSGLRVALYGEDKQGWNQIRRECFEWALSEAGYDDVKEIPCITENAQILLTGLLIMADWIASNETYFPLLHVLEEGNDSYYPERIENALEKLSLPEPWEVQLQYLGDELFKERFTFPPRLMQKDIIETVTEIQNPGILILEASMGSGKTEAALAAAELLAGKTDAGGLFFGLPTQATANSIFERLIPWAQMQSEEAPHSIRLAHGNAELYRAMFQGESQVDEDETDDSRLFIHSWFQGKKQALLADFVVGTVDQLLLAALKKRHVMLRHLGMAGKVIIIDECHAYDVYTSKYLDRTLAWAGAYGQPVIILSATLPARRRKELLEAYLNKKSKGIISKKIEENLSYPLLTYTDGAEICQKELRNEPDSRKIEIGTLEKEKLTGFLQEKLKDGGCAAIILNTVKHVQEVAALLKKEFPDKEVLELHSRYLYPDRAQKEEELLRRMGKKSNAQDRNGFILVASQVAEQSLDFDADLLVTELCPMDLFLQRIGREHRHREHDCMRPLQLQQAKCMILQEEGKPYNDGSKAVYGECLLMRTQAVMPSAITIPDDIPNLVQRVYAEEENEFIEIAGYQQVLENYKVQLANKESRAQGFLLRKPQKKEQEKRRETSLNSLLVNSTTVDEKQAEATVRDGGNSLEVLVLQKNGNEISFLPWQKSGEVLSINEVPSEEVSRKVAMQRLRLPASICRDDRIGKVIKELQLQFDKFFYAWKQSPWINGELILLLDENFSAVLQGVRLVYSKENGLIEKEA